MKDFDSLIRRSLSYDPYTGELFRLVNSGGRPAGSKAGCRRKDGYYIVSVGNKLFLAHRIAWFLYYGAWPEHTIDHINRDPSDNRISNLRDVTHSGNMNNVRLKNGGPHRGPEGWEVSKIFEGTKYRNGKYKCYGKALKAYQKLCDGIEGYNPPKMYERGEHI